MRKNISKKGAVELSLNLIIMLIIGMVVLGLVIGFVNSLVSRGTENFNKQLGDNEKLKLDEVKSCSGNLCTNPDVSTKIKKGAEQNLFIKVRAYKTDISCPTGLLSGCDLDYSVTADEQGNNANGITISGPGLNAPEGDEDAQRYFLRVAKDVEVGIYYLTLSLYAETSKTITIEVE
jgi:hypothetical protein